MSWGSRRLLLSEGRNMKRGRVGYEGVEHSVYAPSQPTSSNCTIECKACVPHWRRWQLSHALACLPGSQGMKSPHAPFALQALFVHSQETMLTILTPSRPMVPLWDNGDKGRQKRYVPQYDEEGCTCERNECIRHIALALPNNPDSGMESQSHESSCCTTHLPQRHRDEEVRLGACFGAGSSPTMPWSKYDKKFKRRDGKVNAIYSPSFPCPHCTPQTPRYQL